MTTDKIEPSLSAEEWASETNPRIDAPIARAVVGAVRQIREQRPSLDDAYAAVIAVANYALPDSDPRKITRSMVGNLCVVADALDLIAKEETEYVGHIVGRVLAAAKIREYADALASYLPPEGA